MYYWLFRVWVWHFQSIIIERCVLIWIWGGCRVRFGWGWLCRLGRWCLRRGLVVILGDVFMFYLLDYWWRQYFFNLWWALFRGIRLWLGLSRLFWIWLGIRINLFGCIILKLNGYYQSSLRYLILFFNSLIWFYSLG